MRLYDGTDIRRYIHTYADVWDIPWSSPQGNVLSSMSIMLDHCVVLFICALG